MPTPGLLSQARERTGQPSVPIRGEKTEAQTGWAAVKQHGQDLTRGPAPGDTVATPHSPTGRGRRPGHCLTAASIAASEGPGAPRPSLEGRPSFDSSLPHCPSEGQVALRGLSVCESPYKVCRQWLGPQTLTVPVPEAAVSVMGLVPPRPLSWACGRPSPPRVPTRPSLCACLRPDLFLW